MIKSFIKNIAFVQILNLIIKPLWIFLIDKEAQIIFGEQYAQYYSVFNLAVISNIILDIGIQSFNQNYIAENPQFFKAHLKPFLKLKMVLALFYFVFVLIIGINLKMPFEMLLVLCFNQVLTSLILYFRSNLAGLQLFKTDSVLSVLDKSLAIVICLIFYFTNLKTVLYFIYAQTIALILALIFALFNNLKNYKNISIIDNYQSIGLKQLILKSLPYSLLFALMGLYTRMDILLMNKLLDNSLFHTGIYAYSFRLLDAFAMFAMLFSGILLPMFGRMLSEKQNVVSLLNFSATLLFLISMTVVVSSWIETDKIMQWLYNITEPEILIVASSVFKNIIWCFVPMCFVFVFGTLLTAKKDLKMMNIFAIISVLINLILNLILIPKYQSYGASISSAITQSLFGSLCLWRCFNLFKLKIDIKIVGKLSLFVICLIGVGVWTKGHFNALLFVLIFGISSVCLSLLLKIFDIKKALQVLKFKQS